MLYADFILFIPPRWLSIIQKAKLTDTLATAWKVVDFSDNILAFYYGLINGRIVRVKFETTAARAIRERSTIWNTSFLTHHFNYASRLLTEQKRCRWHSTRRRSTDDKTVIWSQSLSLMYITRTQASYLFTWARDLLRRHMFASRGILMTVFRILFFFAIAKKLVTFPVFVHNDCRRCVSVWNIRENSYDTYFHET